MELLVAGHLKHLHLFLFAVEGDTDVECLVLHVATDVPEAEDGLDGREVAVARTFQL